MSRLRHGAALLALALLPAGAAAGGGAGSTPAPPARVVEPVLPGAGARYVYFERNTGAYGSAALQLEVKVLGVRDWEGRRVLTLRVNHPSLGEFQYWDLQGRLVARDVDGGDTYRWDPPLPRLSWPLAVGEAWSYEGTLRVADERYPVHSRTEVTRSGDLTTPAGTFRVFELVREREDTRLTYWWSPRLGMPARTRVERLDGSGTHERELLSWKPATR